MENASVAMGLERLNQLPHGSSFDLTGWNGLLMGVNLMRMSTLSSDVAVVPWVAYKNDTNMSPFMWMKPMANTHYCTAAKPFTSCRLVCGHPLLRVSLQF